MNVRMLMGFCLLVGCSSSESTEPFNPANLPGTYTLTAITGGTLPLTVGGSRPGDPGTNYEALVGGTVVLTSDSKFTITNRYEYRRLDNSVVSTRNDVSTGTYQHVRSNIVTLNDSRGASYSRDASASNDSIFLLYGSSVYTYSR